jgi:PAS domain S-box-containing protein
MTVSKRATRSLKQRAKRRAPAARLSRAALERRSAQLEFVHDAAGVVSWVWDIAADRFEWFGDRDAPLGLPPGTFSGRYQDYLARVHPDDVAGARRAFVDCLKGRQPAYRAEERLMFPDGSVHWLETFGRAEYGRDGRAVRMAGVVRDITERKSREAALHSCESRFQTAFHASPYPKSITRIRDTCFVAVNAAFERASGYAASEVIGRTALELGMFADEQEREKLFATIRSDGSARVACARLRRKDGTVRIAEFSVELIDIDGEPHRLSQTRDVTEAVRASEQLQESLRKFSAVFETSPEPIAVARSDDGVHLEVNGAWVRIIGRPREEAVGRSALEMGLWVHPAERVRLNAELDRRGRVSNFETRFRRADGGVIDVLLSSEQLELEGERCVVHVWRDVSEQKRAEQALAESEEKFSKAFFAGPEAMTISRRSDGAPVAVNASFERVTGIRAADAIGRTPSELGVWGKPVQRAMETELRATGHLRDFERTLRTPDGREITLLFSAEPIELGGEPHLLTISRDITEQRRAQSRILELNASLEQRVDERTAELQAANRELESFSYTISHDLRAPLRAIIGFTSILTTEHAAALPVEARRYLAMVDRNARRMGELVDDLLEFARVGRGTLEVRPLDMRALVAMVLDDLDAAGRVEIGELPAARGDASLLRQVWHNLLSNAIKFSRNSASPRIGISGAALPDGGVEYCVRDNGCGFDMRYAGKLFGVFQRLHSEREFEGTGVGLAIAQRIVTRHGGSIRAESSPGDGARFSFILPA